MLDALHGDASHSRVDNPHDPARGCPCGSSHDAPKGGGRLIPEHIAGALTGTFAKPSIIMHINEPQQVNPNPCALGIHHWAYLAGGGQACGVCGTRR